MNLTSLSLSLEEIELQQIVDKLRLKSNHKCSSIYEKIKKQEDLCSKLILAREYLTPQSILMEKVIKNDLEIDDKFDSQSGDGIKNGIKYEIKVSLHDRECKFNFVQIRPDHYVDFYIFVGYNLFDGYKGRAFILKVPAEFVYDLLIEGYGGYAHGTNKSLGNIDRTNFKGRNCEYVLRPNPNMCLRKCKVIQTKDGKKITKMKNTKANILWQKLLQFEVPYKKEYF